MSIKKLIRQSIEQKEIIDEIKNILVNKSFEKISVYTKTKSISGNEVIKILINVGNMIYEMGDLDNFEYFVKTIFEIITKNVEEAYTEDLMKHINFFGHMSVHNHNINSFYIIINNLKEKICDLEDSVNTHTYIDVLKDLVLKSETEGFDIGLFETIKVFNDIHDHFMKNNMHVNMVYLKNIIISLIYYAKTNKKDNLSNKIINETQTILNMAS